MIVIRHNNDEDINGGEDMANIKELIYNQENVSLAVNPKEEAEVVIGLFQGNYVYEDRKAIRDVRHLKIIGEL